MNIIEIKDLKFKYPSNDSKNINFQLVIDYLSIQKNKVYALLGPNGSGKSTLIKLILNLIINDVGDIKLFGTSNREKTSRSKIGYLPEEYNLPMDYTFKDFLFYFGKMKDISFEKLKDEINQLGIELNMTNNHNKKIKELSKGLLQSLTLYHSLIGENELYILDEPFNGLDPVQKKRTIEFLKKKQKQDLSSIIISTHILSDLEGFANEIILINNGRIIDQKLTTDIYNKYISIEKFYFENVK